MNSFTGIFQQFYPNFKNIVLSPPFSPDVLTQAPSAPPPISNFEEPPSTPMGIPGLAGICQMSKPASILIWSADCHIGDSLNIFSELRNIKMFQTRDVAVLFNITYLKRCLEVLTIEDPGYSIWLIGFTWCIRLSINIYHLSIFGMGVYHRYYISFSIFLLSW